jgi:hypothetical protein
MVERGPAGRVLMARVPSHGSLSPETGTCMSGKILLCFNLFWYGYEERARGSGYILL